MASTACFAIVSKNDNPIYEAEVGSASKKEDLAYQHQFILHAALDVVQDLAWSTNAMFLKSVDRFNDLVVSVYFYLYNNIVFVNLMTHARFMLLHDSRSEDGIKSFFQEVHELYIKIFLNPLYLPGSRITSSHFDTKVRALARSLPVNSNLININSDRCVCSEMVRTANISRQLIGGGEDLGSDSGSTHPLTSLSEPVRLVLLKQKVPRVYLNLIAANRTQPSCVCMCYQVNQEVRMRCYTTKPS
uniref:Trafficking protein particle complex subunit n=1 Tax=Oryza punctata TaxID=4537 RepID=A0A0E0KSH4_ORYPU